MAYLIYYISAFVWLLPPIRQYRGKLFLYFLILAFADLLTRISSVNFHTNAFQIHCLISFASVLSVSISNTSMRMYVLIFIGFILTLFISITQTRNIIILYMVILHLIILWFFLKETLISFSKNNYLTLGWVMLILYEISIVLKFIIVLEATQASIIFYYLTTAFEILIAIFFTIYKVEDSPKIKLKSFDVDL